MSESDNSMYITICVVCVCFISISISVFLLLSKDTSTAVPAAGPLGAPPPPFGLPQPVAQPAVAPPVAVPRLPIPARMVFTPPSFIPGQPFNPGGPKFTCDPDRRLEGALCF